ncbi:MAG: DUF1553 domain-containing protein [Planctomycetes bacterium]|nr:DUF1553 domain-containing protein [Planctomycetota bacterium]
MAAVLMVSAIAVAGLGQGPSMATAADQVDYFRQVLPILSQHCYACHGPDAAVRKGDLRLDQRAGAFKDLGDGLHVIVAGKPESSALVDRITSDDKKFVMPPPKVDDALTAAEIATLERWVAEGASWPEHWAFNEPVLVKPPKPEAVAWRHNPIDRFVHGRLAEKGFKPAALADKAAIIRRVTFDLTGLPPSLEEIDAFVKDDRPEAYAEVVDRLLSSPRFGERQAQDWLDLARYADTNGYQRDGGRSAWKWRDWVINAFNANMPFDRFTIEQLAGDLLPEATLEQKIATGFNRNHATNSEGGSEPDEYRSAYVIDRVNTTATTWLGLTVACAQCHDHKFDPIQQKDFYKFYAYFNQIDERDTRQPDLRVPNPDQQPHVAYLKARIAELKKRLEGPDAISDAAQAKWEVATRAFVGDDVAWTTAKPIGMLAHNGSILERQDDGSILATGEAPVRDTYDLVFKPGTRKISAIKLAVLPDPSQPDGASGRSRKGQFILSGLKMRLSALSDSTDPPLVFVAKADTDLNQERPKERKPDQITPGGIAGSIVATDSTTGGGGRSRGGGGWSIIGDERMKPHEAILVPLETLTSNSVSTLRVTLSQTSRPYKTLIGRFRISFTDDERIRELMLPAVGKIWSAVGPFPAKDVDGAYKTAFEPEKELKTGIDLKKQYDKPKVETPKPTKKTSGDKSSTGKPGSSKPSGGTKPSATKKPATSKKPEQPDASGKPSSVKTSGKGKVSGKKPSGKPANPKEEEKKPGEKGGLSKGKTGSQQEGGTKPPGPSQSGDSSGSSRRRQRTEKLSWTKKQAWRDGTAARLADGNVAWYVTRKIHSTRSRTVIMRFDGPDGVRAWLNGELVFEAAPKARTTSSRRRGSSGGGGGGSFSRGRGSTGSDDRKVRLGMREGENELVVKVVFGGGRSTSGRSRRGGSSNANAGATNPAAGGVPDFTGDPEALAAAAGVDPTNFDPANFDPSIFQNMRRGRSGGGGSFTFNLTPEGADVVNHEVVCALRELAPATDPSSADGSCGPNEDDKKLTREQVLRKKIRTFYRANRDMVGKLLKAELDKLEGEVATLERKMPQTLVMKEREKKRDTHVFMRGDFRNHGDKVEAGLPAVLPPMAKDLPRNRLGLAKWLVSGKNPLTARVTVNRIWQQYFGTGLVRTSEDFGIRSEAPSHPGLLDWLAHQFVASGWDIKALHKLIATSQTYRQASAFRDDMKDVDPENRLLGRGPRQRLSAEMVRDNALAVSALLVEKIGGESVRPYQPKGLWQAVARGQRYRQDKGDKLYRRGLYVYWKRGVPYPSAVTFDQAKRETCTVKRAETTTPLQALVLLNDPVYVECAKMLAQRLFSKGGADDLARLKYGFLLCTGKEADEKQVGVLSKLLGSQREHYKKDADAAKKLLAVGAAKIDEKLDKSELAAWTAVASALLNLDASIHR